MAGQSSFFDLDERYRALSAAGDALEWLARALAIRPRHEDVDPKGVQAERWFHAMGCRRWFNVVRDTVTHKITRAYPMGGELESAE